MYIYYILFLLLSVLFFMALRIAFYYKKEKVLNINRISLSEITVLVPFRNEEKNLGLFFASLSKQKVFPYQILFIDDHSEDDSCQIVEHYKKNNSYVELLSLTKECGKKAALLKGVEAATTEYILTMDADVCFHEDYFKSLLNLSKNDLISLPVLMESKSVLGRFFSVEHTFFNAFNFMLSPLYPISVSGANMLYRKSALDYSSQLKEHKHLSSGDDYFLLKALRKKKARIEINNNFNSTVITAAPESFNAYFQQRLRWLSKTKFKMNFGEALLGFYIAVYFLGGFITLISCLIFLDLKLFFFILLLRYMMDSFIFITYARGFNRVKDLLFLPIFQLAYPVLMFGVYILSFFRKPKWKGRPIQ